MNFDEMGPLLSDERRHNEEYLDSTSKLDSSCCSEWFKC